jgi:hypothetical protein
MSERDKFWDDVGFELFIFFCWLSLLGLAFLITALVIGKTVGALAVVGALFIVPAVIHGVLLTIWHWKSRYNGSHSKLWGALLIIENTGWSRLIYFFRHVLPDKRNRGRYATVQTPQA